MNNKKEFYTIKEDTLGSKNFWYLIQPHCRLSVEIKSLNTVILGWKLTKTSLLFGKELDLYQLVQFDLDKLKDAHIDFGNSILSKKVYGLTKLMQLYIEHQFLNPLKEERKVKAIYLPEIEKIELKQQGIALLPQDSIQVNIVYSFKLRCTNSYQLFGRTLVGYNLQLFDIGRHGMSMKDFYDIVCCYMGEDVRIIICGQLFAHKAKPNMDKIYIQDHKRLKYTIPTFLSDPSIQPGAKNAKSILVIPVEELLSINQEISFLLEVIPNEYNLPLVLEFLNKILSNPTLKDIFNQEKLSAFAALKTLELYKTSNVSDKDLELSFSLYHKRLSADNEGKEIIFQHNGHYYCMRCTPQRTDFKSNLGFNLFLELKGFNELLNPIFKDVSTKQLKTTTFKIPILTEDNLYNEAYRFQPLLVFFDEYLGIRKYTYSLQAYFLSEKHEDYKLIIYNSSADTNIKRQDLIEILKTYNFNSFQIITNEDIETSKVLDDIFGSYYGYYLTENLKNCFNDPNFYLCFLPEIMPPNGEKNTKAKNAWEAFEKASSLEQKGMILLNYINSRLSTTDICREIKNKFYHKYSRIYYMVFAAIHAGYDVREVYYIISTTGNTYSRMNELSKEALKSFNTIIVDKTRNVENQISNFIRINGIDLDSEDLKSVNWPLFLANPIKRLDSEVWNQFLNFYKYPMPILTFPFNWPIVELGVNLKQKNFCFPPTALIHFFEKITESTDYESFFNQVSENKLSIYDSLVLTSMLDALKKYNNKEKSTEEIKQLLLKIFDLCTDDTIPLKFSLTIIHWQTDLWENYFKHIEEETPLIDEKIWSAFYLSGNRQIFYSNAQYLKLLRNFEKTIRSLYLVCETQEKMDEIDLIIGKIKEGYRDFHGKETASPSFHSIYTLHLLLVIVNNKFLGSILTNGFPKTTEINVKDFFECFQCDMPRDYAYFITLIKFTQGYLDWPKFKEKLNDENKIDLKIAEESKSLVIKYTKNNENTTSKSNSLIKYSNPFWQQKNDFKLLKNKKIATKNGHVIFKIPNSHCTNVKEIKYALLKTLQANYSNQQWEINFFDMDKNLVKGNLNPDENYKIIVEPFLDKNVKFFIKFSTLEKLIPVRVNSKTTFNDLFELLHEMGKFTEIKSQRICFSYCGDIIKNHHDYILSHGINNNKILHLTLKNEKNENRRPIIIPLSHLFFYNKNSIRFKIQKGILSSTDFDNYKFETGMYYIFYNIEINEYTYYKKDSDGKIVRKSIENTNNYIHEMVTFIEKTGLFSNDNSKELELIWEHSNWKNNKNNVFKFKIIMDDLGDISDHCSAPLLNQDKLNRLLKEFELHPENKKSWEICNDTIPKNIADKVKFYVLCDRELNLYDDVRIKKLADAQGIKLTLCSEKDLYPMMLDVLQNFNYIPNETSQFSNYATFFNLFLDELFPQQKQWEPEIEEYKERIIERKDNKEEVATILLLYLILHKKYTIKEIAQKIQDHDISKLSLNSWLVFVAISSFLELDKILCVLYEKEELLTQTQSFQNAPWIAWDGRCSKVFTQLERFIQDDSKKKLLFAFIPEVDKHPLQTKHPHYVFSLCSSRKVFSCFQNLPPAIWYLKIYPSPLDKTSEAVIINFYFNSLQEKISEINWSDSLVESTNPNDFWGKSLSLYSAKNLHKLNKSHPLCLPYSNDYKTQPYIYILKFLKETLIKLLKQESDIIPIKFKNIKEFIANEYIKKIDFGIGIFYKISNFRNVNFRKILMSENIIVFQLLMVTIHIEVFNLFLLEHDIASSNYFLNSTSKRILDFHDSSSHRCQAQIWIKDFLLEFEARLPGAYNWFLSEVDRSYCALKEELNMLPEHTTYKALTY